MWSAAKRLTSGLARLRSRHNKSRSLIWATVKPRSRAAIDAQGLDVIFGIDPIVSGRALRESDQAGFLIIPNHLGPNTCCAGGFTDVHFALTVEANRFSRKAFVRTKTEYIALAPAASIGHKSVPLTGYSMPAATGMSATL